jgi:hypothetical protein
LTMLGGYFFFFLIAAISSFVLYEFYGLAQLLAGLELGRRDGSVEETMNACMNCATQLDFHHTNGEQIGGFIVKIVRHAQIENVNQSTS